MAFNTAGFLFLFFPVSLMLYWLIPGRNGKNILLAVLSAVFFAFGGPAQLPVLLLAAVWNYALGLLCSRDVPRRTLWRTLGVVGDLALLGVYKYLSFFLSVLGLPVLSRPLGLPLGISFFTFHGISYLLDIARETAPAERRFDRFFVYFAFFPRLLAGPIVRWRDAAGTLADHPTSTEDTAAGLRRFAAGMSKKLLLSESAGAVANAVFALSPDKLGASLAWVGAVAYCLQLFFDFSGYSDMAIGLGRLFGFEFPENFDYPYISRSLREFWRRWHMTLNRWFVDYLYVPLGGSRKGPWTAVRNTLIVFFFTGLWHGAGWTFILWGLWHGLFVAAERFCRPAMERLERRGAGRAVLHLYTLLVVVLGFVMFRAETVGAGLAMLGKMFSFTGAGLAGKMAAESILTADRIVGMALGLLFCLPAAPALRARFQAAGRTALWETGGNILALAGLALCILAMAGGSFTPFIYQQF